MSTKTMNKIQLEAITPVGKFISKIDELSDMELRGLNVLIESKNLSYFTINGINGDTITLTSEVCKNTVFIIKPIKS